MPAGCNIGLKNVIHQRAQTSTLWWEVLDKLRGVVSGYVIFTNREVLWGLVAVHPGATNQWPQTTLFSQVLLPLDTKPSGLDTGITEVTTQTPTLVANMDTDRCTTPPFGIEGENQYLLVITTSI